MVNIYKLWQDGQRKKLLKHSWGNTRAWTQGSGVPGESQLLQMQLSESAQSSQASLPLIPEAAVLLGESSLWTLVGRFCGNWIIPPLTVLFVCFVFNKAFYNTKIIIWRVVQKSQCDFFKKITNVILDEWEINWFNCKKNPINKTEHSCIA